MTPAELSTRIVEQLSQLQAQGIFDAAAAIPESIVVERPKRADQGDWSTNVAMQLARSLHTAPRDIAQHIADGLSTDPAIDHVDVAGPGFLNVWVTADAAGALVPMILQAGEQYGHSTVLAGRTIDMEFVSANPTGPLHIGHTRWAALGDSISRILRASGATLSAEYYINDAGVQMDRFAESVLAAIHGEPTPEGGYPGQYIQDLAATVLKQRPDLATLDAAEALGITRELAYAQQLAEIRQSLNNFNVHFDVWFSERSLHAADPSTGRSKVDDALERLRQQGYVYEADGAIWIRTTAFGDDKDRVFKKSDGETTYFASDAAYYLDKRDRGFEELIYLLGADHHGYVGRLTALAAAAGDDPEQTLTVLIGQLVNLGGAKLSKRAGNIIELDDLLSWLGADALRYSLARYPADSPLNLDGEDLRKRTNDNPVFYVQYAHARTHQVHVHALESGIPIDGFDGSTLTHERERALLAKLGEYSEVVRFSAELREPHRIARYLEQLAGVFHRWYDECRVIPLGDAPVESVHTSRLLLNDATGQVLRNGLDLLGVSAPDKM